MGNATALVRQVNGLTLIGKTGSNHWVVMDGAPGAGGSGAGTSPKDLVLLGLGGCTASDVIAILAKKRSPAASVEVRIEAETSEEHPRVYTAIRLEYLVYGDGIDERDVARAVELSTTKYCAVTAMLAASARMTHSIRILPADAARTGPEPRP